MQIGKSQLLGNPANSMTLGQSYTMYPGDISACRREWEVRVGWGDGTTRMQYSMRQALLPQALIGDEMRKGYRTIVSKHERSALLGPIRDRVMAAFAGDGSTWSGQASSHHRAAGDEAPKYNAKEVKVALKVSMLSLPMTGMVSS